MGTFTDGAFLHIYFRNHSDYIILTMTTDIVITILQRLRCHTLSLYNKPDHVLCNGPIL